MAKYYVESGQVRLIFDAEDVWEAAVRTFQWSCDRQAGISASSPLEHVCEAEERGWQLDDAIWVSETGFGGHDCAALNTREVVAVWQGSSFPWSI